MNTFEYIVFRDSHNSLKQEFSENICLFREFNELLSAKISFTAIIVIESISRDYVHDLLWKIRTHHQFYYWLCFVNAPIYDYDRNLIDGQNLSADQQSQLFNSFKELDASYKPREEPLFRDDRLIRYLWVRPDHIIKSYKDWRQPRIYIYPLLDALVFNEIEVYAWINSLTANNVLVKQSLIDRQRECPHCYSAHLSFVDVCPNCESIDIIKQVALHCFVCGQVAPQEDFLRKGVLVCPKCETHLKHIGSDYDRPIENYSCNQCSHFFIEGTIKARCTACNQSMNTEELALHEIFSLQLSEYGQINALRGAIADVLAIFSGKNFVANEVFVHDLDWLLLQSDRYKEIEFSVLGLCFVNLHEALKESNQAAVLSKIEAIAERIKELLREPDLCTRSTENVIWLLLPQTGKEGLSGLKTRLINTIAILQKNEKDSSKLLCKFTDYYAAQRIKNEPADLLLARLRGEIF